MRVEAGQVALKTRKGLDRTNKFPAIARAAHRLPDCILDGEIVALDDDGSPDFAGLQAALSEEKTDDLIFFAFDLLFEATNDLRTQTLVERKDALNGLLKKIFGRQQIEIRYVEHFASSGDAVLCEEARQVPAGRERAQLCRRDGRRAEPCRQGTVAR